MRRDDPALAGRGAYEEALEVAREPVYFGANGGLFGWHHRSPAAVPRDGVAVLCAPFGPEYTRAHRALRHLADRLARRGISTLRFDWHAVGDSAGSDADAGLFERWRANVVQAAAQARLLGGRERLCLVGLRLGGTLAALAADEAGADVVATWNAVGKGRSYARELQAMAATARDASAETAGGLESAGFRIHEETLAAIRAVDLDAASLPREARVKHWKRDDLPGWDGLLADHQFTVVPDAALDAIAAWVEAQVPQAEPAHAPGSGPAGRAALELGGMRETACRFGERGQLFGILARPATPGDGPTVVMLNAGSIHHAGPHRLYVRLARELACLGYPALRFDLEGIGDSVLTGPGRENHPYSPTALRDIEAALACLRREHGSTRFVVLGLCSGAYNTFQAGLHLEDPGIERLVMINPWYFHWHEGLSLDTTLSSHYEDVAAYHRAARDPERWKRLARGEADLGRLARVAAAHLAKVARGRWHDLRGMLFPSSGTRLSQDVRRIAGRGRRMHVILSDGEPAAAILETEAARAVRFAKRAGLFTLDLIPGGDHTFSRSGPREALVRRIVEILGDGRQREQLLQQRGLPQIKAG